MVSEAVSAQSYTATILPRPSIFPYAYGEGAGAGFQAGYGLPQGGSFPTDARALLWPNGQMPRDITPAGYHAARVEDAEDDQLVGYVSFYGNDFRAGLWLGGGSSFVDLHPSEFTLSGALGCGGGLQAGHVLFSQNCFECGSFVEQHAGFWAGSAASFTRLHAPGFYRVLGTDTDGKQFVGWGFANSNTAPFQALLWTNSASTAISLHPLAGFECSFATGVANGEQGGYGSGPATDDWTHALLWRGSPQSVVDLNPPGYFTSTVEAVRDGVQVGTAARWEDYVNRAFVWRGTPGSGIDLHELLPAGYRLRDSLAKDIDAEGNIVGIATEDFTQQTVAVIWRYQGGIAPPPATDATKLSVSSVAGRRGRTVTLTARLTTTGGNPVMSRLVAFKVSGTQVGSAVTNTTGTAQLSYQIPRDASLGSKPLVATFAGDSAYGASTGSATLTVNR
jgi:hypothetical protein